MTHSSPSGRRQHAEGKKHKQNQVNYYRNIKIMMEEEIRARALLKWLKYGSMFKIKMIKFQLIDAFEKDLKSR